MLKRGGIFTFLLMRGCRVSNVHLEDFKPARHSDCGKESEDYIALILEP